MFEGIIWGLWYLLEITFTQLPWSIGLQIMCTHCNLPDLEMVVDYVVADKSDLFSLAVDALCSSCWWLVETESTKYSCGMHCGASTESILHVLWLCQKQFWSKLRQHYSRSMFSWGAVLWGILHGDVMKYESRHASLVFHFSYGQLHLTSFPSSIARFRIEILVI